VARANLKDLPPPPKQRSPRGRTLLQQILAPLLAKRSDLALVGDLLVIRPVRHLVRGAQFRWHEHQTDCSACPFIQPLYQNVLPFIRDAAVSAYIENPIFAPMLFDRLAEEIFEPLGKIATIEDFIESKWGKHLWPVDLFPSILLSRGLEEAQAYVAPFRSACEEALAEANARLAATDRKDKMAMCHRTAEAKRAEEAITTAKQRETFLASGHPAVFGHYHAWETEVVRALKLKEIWEPSPFPAELPPMERAAKTADPIFTPTPWLDFPDTWRQDPPEAPGEVRYGRSWWDQRHGRVRLIDPITREQAEERHRNRESYVLATRLCERQLLVLTFLGSSKDRRALFPTQYLLRLYDSQGRYMLAEFREDQEDPGILKMTVIDIRKIDNGYGWHSYLNFDANQKTIHDDRTKENRYLRQKMTAAERAAYAFPLPRFDEFGILWERISKHLDAEGFGAFK
jgi:hypothetical protein